MRLRVRYGYKGFHLYFVFNDVVHGPIDNAISLGNLQIFDVLNKIYIYAHYAFVSVASVAIFVSMDQLLRHVPCLTVGLIHVLRTDSSRRRDGC